MYSIVGVHSLTFSVFRSQYIFLSVKKMVRVYSITVILIILLQITYRRKKPKKPQGNSGSGRGSRRGQGPSERGQGQGYGYYHRRVDESSPLLQERTTGT